MKETELLEAIGSLPRSIRPPRDLWPSIESRLGGLVERPADYRRVSAWRWPAMAAGLMLALTTGIFIGRGLDGGSVEPAAYSMVEFALAGGVETAEREYQAAFSELLPLDYSGSSLVNGDPEALRKSWEDMQQAEAMLLAALAQYPSNLYLGEKLLDLRSRQLQFVRQLALLEQNDWRRT